MKINKRVASRKKKSTRERSYFLDIVLVGVRVVFLPDNLLVLSLLKHRGVETFLNQKNEKYKQEKSLK